MSTESPDALSKRLPKSREEFEPHIRGFEAWFGQRQRDVGLSGHPLLDSERALLMSYIQWVRGADAVNQGR